MFKPKFKVVYDYDSGLWHVAIRRWYMPFYRRLGGMGLNSVEMAHAAKDNMERIYG